MDLEHLEMDFKLSKTKFKRDFPDFPIRRITFSDFFVEEEDLDSAADDDDDEEGDNLYDKERDELEPVIFLKYLKNFAFHLQFILVYNIPRRSFGKTQ